jgi:hypothetical protein
MLRALVDDDSATTPGSGFCAGVITTLFWSQPIFSEQHRFDDRTDASKSTAQGKLSQDAAYQLGQAAECMEEAIVALREAVGSQGD